MDCCYFQKTSYGVFSERLHQKVLQNRIPVAASIELTARCNLHCVHCYINKDAADQQENQRNCPQLNG